MTASEASEAQAGYRTPADARRWTEQGTAVFLAAAGALDDQALDRPSVLPGWTRRHVLAHVAANAEALGNLVRWAATGEPSPMYASPETRTDAITRGVHRSAAELTAWLSRSAAELESGLAGLRPQDWSRPVMTAQGRTVPATEITWLRAREVYIHAVDLAAGVSFADLPSDFLVALEADVVGKRGRVPEVEGRLADRVAWLTGRPHTLCEAPELPPWL